jgi:Na+/H+-dicarboxylate symporter
MTESKSLFARYRELSLGVRILIWMVVGGILGGIFGERAMVVAPLGQLFIKLLMMTAVPLVFFNLIAGLTSLTDVRALGRLGLKISVYYVFTTVTALTLGLITMHALQPGKGLVTPGETVEQTFGEVPAVQDVILDLVPQHAFAAFAQGNVAQVVVFAVLLGIAALLMPAPDQEKLRNAFELLAKLMRKLVELILRVSPVAFGALAASMVGEYGSRILGPLGVFLAGVWGAQAVMVIIYLTALYVMTKRSPWDFLKKTAPLYATTAATCSSLASLVVSLDVAEKRMKLPRSVYSFTLPLGAQMNKDGTSIMLAGVLLMAAQSAGVEFTLASQITIILIGLLLSNGSGGIPGGGLVIAMIFVQAFNLPMEIAAMVGGIYRLVDMGSTTINCMGDMVGTTIVADSEAKRAEALKSQTEVTVE